MEKFVLASSSDFELEAVRRALIQVGVRNTTVLGVDPSPNDPVNTASVVERAAVRVYRILEMFSSDVKIGIGGAFSNSESLRGTFFLLEAVMLVTPPRREILTMCPAVAATFDDFPGLVGVHRYSVQEIGQFLAEQFAADPNDPHLYLTKGRVSRMDTLIAGLVTAFKQM